MKIPPRPKLNKKFAGAGQRQESQIEVPPEIPVGSNSGFKAPARPGNSSAQVVTLPPEIAETPVKAEIPNLSRRIGDYAPTGMICFKFGDVISRENTEWACYKTNDCNASFFKIKDTATRINISRHYEAGKVIRRITAAEVENFIVRKAGASSKSVQSSETKTIENTMSKKQK